MEVKRVTCIPALQSLSHHSSLYSSQFYRQLSLGRSSCGFKVAYREGCMVPS